MQKKIIALAVAGLVSGVAFAQTNVTVYGIVDAGYVYSKSNTGLPAGGDYKFSGIKDGFDDGLNGSRVGFKGEEALGNGLKAIFQMELRLNAVNGQQSNPMRQSFVGLSSATMGTFMIGRQYNAIADVYGNNSSNSVTGINPVNIFQGQGFSQIVSAGGNARQSNAIKYVSPNWSGFTGRVSYAFSDNLSTTSAGFDPKASTTDNGRWALSGDYTNGPLNVDLGLARASSVRGNPNGDQTNSSSSTVLTPDLLGNNINEWYVGGAYDFKVVKLFGSYQHMNNNNNNVLAITKSKLWQIGAGVPIGNGKLNFEYARVDFQQDNNTPALQQDGGNKGFGIGYEYYMSKRTTAYAYYSNLKYDSNTASTSGVTAGGLPAAGGAQPGTAALGETQNNFNIGLRHVF